MAKFSLTQTGVEGFTAKLYKFSNEKLRSEATLLAEDPRAYIAAQFEMQVHQLEFIRNLNDDFMCILGWSLATALLSRRPITYSMMNDITDVSSCNDACILLSSQFSHHLGEGAVSATGKITVRV
jgi:hypothetical protein